MTKFERAMALKDEALQFTLRGMQDGLEWASNIAGFGIGGDADLDNWYVRVYVAFDSPRLESLFSPLLGPFQVVVSGRFRALGTCSSAATGVVTAPAAIGAKIESVLGTEHGTLCLFLCQNGSPFLLSCGHVLNGPLCDIIKNLNTGAVIGKITAQSPDFVRSQPNAGDWALGSALAGFSAALPAGLGKLATTPVAPVIGTPVIRAGRNSQPSGTIFDPSANILVDFSNGASDPFPFSNQVLINSPDGVMFADDGDSGSLVVTDTNPRQAVAMVFAKNVPPPSSDANQPFAGSLIGAFPLASFLSSNNLSIISSG